MELDFVQFLMCLIKESSVLCFSWYTYMVLFSTKEELSHKTILIDFQAFIQILSEIFYILHVFLKRCILLCCLIYSYDLLQNHDVLP